MLCPGSPDDLMTLFLNIGCLHTEVTGTLVETAKSHCFNSPLLATTLVNVREARGIKVSDVFDPCVRASARLLIRFYCGVAQGQTLKVPPKTKRWGQLWYKHTHTNIRKSQDTETITTPSWEGVL